MATKKKQYRVNWELQMDGAQHAAGELIELDDDTAAPLIACGMISDPKDDLPDTGEAGEG